MFWAGAGEQCFYGAAWLLQQQMSHPQLHQRPLQVGDWKSTLVQCLFSGKGHLGLASLTTRQNPVLVH